MKIFKLVQSTYFREDIKITAYEETRFRRGRNKEEQPDIQFGPLII